SGRRAPAATGIVRSELSPRRTCPGRPSTATDQSRYQFSAIRTKLESVGGGSRVMDILPALHAVTWPRDAEGGGKVVTGRGVIGAVCGNRTTRSYPGNRGSASVAGIAWSSTFTAAGTTRTYGGS